MTELQFSKRIFFQEYPSAMVLLVINELIGVALMLIGLGTIIPFLGGLLGGSKELSGPLGEFLGSIGIYTWSNIQIMGFLVGLMSIRIILDAVRLYLAGSIGVRLNRTIKEFMNHAIAETDWMGFSGIDQGKYMQCMVAESSLARGAVSDLASAFAYGLITVLLLGWMAVYSFEMFMIVGTLGGVFMWTNRRLMKSLHHSSRQRIELMSQMNIKLTDIRHIFKILLAENLVKTMASTINSLIKKTASVERRQLFLAVLVDNYVAFFGLLIVAGMSMTHFMLYDSTGSTLLFDLILLQRIASYFGNFQSKRKSMLQKIPSYEACLEMMRLPRTPHLDTHKHGKILSIENGIRLENASFSYENSRQVLKNINVRLPAKGLVYFIGPSGSGKTSLIDLIIGLLPPEAGGQILIDGKNLKELDAKSWSRLIAYVPQEAYILAGALRDYFTFGCEDVSDERIWQALRQADAERIVVALPKGLDTIVRSGGGNFSGGERHRLSIARALIREVKVLFLDEPSSALDRDTEQVVFNALRALASEMLIVVATHSRDVIRGMDRLYLFDHGELVWSGNYDQLPEQEALTAALSNLSRPSIT